MAVTFGRTCLDLRGKIEYSRKNEKGVIVLQGRPAAERQRNVEEYFTGVQAANAFLEKAAAEATAGLGWRNRPSDHVHLQHAQAPNAPHACAQQQSIVEQDRIDIQGSCFAPFDSVEMMQTWFWLKSAAKRMH